MSGQLLPAIWARPDRRPALPPRTWETLLGQARRSRLLARLACHATDNGWMDEVPLPVRAYLEGAMRLLERQRQEVLAEAAHIRRALVDIEKPVVLLKGTAYLAAGLPPARGRLFSDIDLMVHPQQIGAVEGALFAAGWISQERDTYNQRYYRQWMHEIPPLQHIHRHSVIDVHHTISPPTSRFRVDGARLFERIVPIGDTGFHMLAPADMVLHSAVHLFQEGEFDHGLRDLLDMHDLLLHFGRNPGFWPDLLARARELGLGEPLFHALHHNQRLFGFEVPAEHADAVAALRPGWLRRQVMSALLVRALRPNHPSCDMPGTGFARWLLYVRSHWIRMPLHLIVPHLVRKAYMRRFPDKDDKAAQPAAPHA